VVQEKIKLWIKHWRVTIVIFPDYLKPHTKIQTNRIWLRCCCKSPKLRKNKGLFAKNCTKLIACLLKMILVHFEITAWKWYALQTACVKTSEKMALPNSLAGEVAPILNSFLLKLISRFIESVSELSFFMQHIKLYIQ
jgi:hypothetical protein